MARILVVDDEPSHRDSLRRILERAGMEVVVAGDGERALEALRAGGIQVVLTDLVMPRMDGMALLRAAKAVAPEIDVILMTAYGTVENAVAAMREGAYDFLVKPTKRGEVIACVERVLERQALLVENRALKAELKGIKQGRDAHGLIGNSPAMIALEKTLQQVAPSNATVLLIGESGTGKELCARALHDLSARATGPFVAVNCAALPDSILESELFGTEKGAYTGAVERPGRFERAHGGTLFLDEIADLPLPMQPKLLRVLQEGEVERLGGTAPRKVDVRLVAATNIDLKDRVQKGLFREDLFYRLDVVELSLPPLRARDGDVPVLATYFLRQQSARHGKGVTGIEQRAMAALSSWSFPGNVRELENAVERAVVLCPGDTVRFEDLPQQIQEAAGAPVADDKRTLTFRVGQTLEIIERAAIDATLKHTGGDKNLTAKLLGLSLRTLYRRLGERPDGDVVDDS
jgi:two-component system, NtrC family, response regulator HydG